MTVCAMMTLPVEAAGISETQVIFYQTTRRNIQEDTHILFRKC
jgi:hypothetical protein